MPLTLGHVPPAIRRSRHDPTGRPVHLFGVTGALSGRHADDFQNVGRVLAEDLDQRSAACESLRVPSPQV